MPETSDPGTVNVPEFFSLTRSVASVERADGGKPSGGTTGTTAHFDALIAPLPTLDDEEPDNALSFCVGFQRQGAFAPWRM
jgi:hypothetical protein